MILDLSMQPRNHFKLLGISLWISLEELVFSVAEQLDSHFTGSSCGVFSASVSHLPTSTWSTLGAKIVFQFDCALCTTELATLPHPYNRKWFARLRIVELTYLFLLLCCNSEGARPSWAATTSPLPAREAIHCVSFNNYCVAEVVSAVPQLPCSGTKLIFLGSFAKQVLEH